MFNQTRLEIKPSIRVAILLSIPCIASLILILAAQIPLFIFITLISFHLYLSYHIITKLALLSSPHSITTLVIENQTIFLEDQNGTRFTAKSLEKSIIFPVFTLLSFDCEEAFDSNLKTVPITEFFTAEKYKSSAGNLIRYSLGIISKLFNKTFLYKNRRHLFICRYNAANPIAFRRVRVWFKFND